ncbi:MAG: type II secretion system protein [Myxococcota bacterium]
MRRSVIQRGASSETNGFTLLEVVAVIAIIAMLGAIALLRAGDLATSAHANAFESTRGAFSAGVALVHAGWIANGAAVDVDAVALEDGATVGVNDAGWPENAQPTGGDGVVTTTECVEVWAALLRPAPAIASTVGGAPWLASVPDPTTCRYAHAETPGIHFDYVTTTGRVSASARATPSRAASPAGATPIAGIPLDDPLAGVPAEDPTGAEACGLVGIEPLLALALVRLRPRRFLRLFAVGSSGR